jgi:hypothetical protein
MHRSSHSPLFAWFVALPGLALALLIVACDASPTNSPESPEPGRPHARSFDWDSPPEALAKAASRRARFETRAAWGAALRTLHEELTRPGASDTFWKPLDHSCPEIDLAVWNRFGEVRVGDTLLFDEDSLRSRCRPVEDPGLAENAPMKTAAYAIAESQHRVYPYKMLGRAWSDLDLFVVRSSGAETQFKKERESWGVRAWWDTDAARIGVRMYLLDCGGSPVVCYFGGEKSNWHRNSDVVLQTDFAGPGEMRVQTTDLPPGRKRLDLKVSAAVIALHSADHAGIRFRATSTAGLAPSTPLYAMPALAYVTW